MSGQPPRKSVYCDRAEDFTVARLWGNDYFCAMCGATDHEEVS